MEKEWFAVWFDSPYYHTLYKSHDEKEAQHFLDNLLGAMKLPAGARVLDLACGKGRHSRYLAGKGFDVTGLDISSASIEHARQFEGPHLSFFQHDMRKPFRLNYFDAVVNFFTSFGYFDTDKDHQTTLMHVARGLRPGGKFLLDYFNSQWVREHLLPKDVKTIDGIDFHVKKWIANGHVFKHVDFDHRGRHYHFEERVRLFDLADFGRLLENAGMQLVETFGDYELGPYDPGTSKRLIAIAQKKPLP